MVSLWRRVDIVQDVMSWCGLHIQQMLVSTWAKLNMFFCLNRGHKNCVCFKSHNSVPEVLVTTLSCTSLLLGSFSSDDGDGNKNVISKYSFSFLYLLCDNWNLFDLENDGELSRNYITIDGVKARKKKENFAVMRSRSRGNIKFGHFTLLFCRGRQRNVPKWKMHVQSDCFCSLEPIVLWRSRCRCRRRC